MRLERRYRVRHGDLPLAALQTRPQMRKTLKEETIQELADNIRQHGLIHPLCVAEVDGRYVVISGHRRLLACRLLEEQEAAVEEVPVIIFENLSPVETALLQASENIHEPVPAHEAAAFYDLVWKDLKKYDPNFTLAEFARAVGRSEQTIRNALCFSLLPARIQVLVASNLLPYGVAVHLVRLSGMMDEEGLGRWAIRFVMAKTKVSEARAEINQYILDVNSGQLNLLDIFTDNARAMLEQSSRRILIDRATSMSFWNGMAYLTRLLGLFERGKIGPEDSPWLRRTPRRAFRELIDVQRRVLAHLELVLSSEEMKQAEHTLERCVAVSDEIESLAR